MSRPELEKIFINDCNLYSCTFCGYHKKTHPGQKYCKYCRKSTENRQSYYKGPEECPARLYQRDNNHKIIINQNIQHEANQTLKFTFFNETM